MSSPSLSNYERLTAAMKAVYDLRNPTLTICKNTFLEQVILSMAAEERRWAEWTACREGKPPKGIDSVQQQEHDFSMEWHRAAMEEAKADPDRILFERKSGSAVQVFYRTEDGQMLPVWFTGPKHKALVFADPKRNVRRKGVEVECMLPQFAPPEWGKYSLVPEGAELWYVRQEGRWGPDDTVGAMVRI